MVDNWKTYKLSELAEVIMGRSPKGETTNLEGGGFPLLNGPIEFGYSHHVPKQFTINPKKTSQVGDLLFCVRGSNTGEMNFSYRSYAIGRGIGAFRSRDGFFTKDVKLTPGVYVGVEAAEEDSEPFDEKMERLKGILIKQFEKGEELKKKIIENFKRL